MALMMDISAAVSIVNVGILGVLLGLYARIYSSTKAVFTVGLMFFAGMLVLHNAIAIYGYFAMAPLYSEELLPYFMGVHFAELAGISALLKITL
jgi:hypothetical protein